MMALAVCMLNRLENLYVRLNEDRTRGLASRMCNKVEKSQDRIGFLRQIGLLFTIYINLIYSCHFICCITHSPCWLG